MIDDHLPVRMCENSTIIEFDSSVGLTCDAGFGQVLVDDAAVLHVGREQAERQLADLGPGHRRRDRNSALPAAVISW